MAAGRRLGTPARETVPLVPAFDEFWSGSGGVPAADPHTARALFASSPLPLRSRCAPFEISGKPAIWIKRDDELSFGASGSKVRKYASLVPALVAAGTTDALVLGARNSNNVLAGAQLLTEAGIRCHLFLRSPRDPELPDTVFDLARQLVPEERITHVPRAEWDERLSRVGQLRAAMARQERMLAVIPEGGSRLESLPGAMTLGLDIRRNERELGREFSDVFIEAGTGLSAIGLALGLAVEPGRRRKLHVLCTAVKNNQFLRLYRRWTAGAGGRVPEVAVYDAGPVPVQWPAGAMAALAEISQATGILFDPYYSGRLLPVVGAALDSGAVGPDTLLVHTGGMGLLPHLEWERNRSLGGRPQMTG